MIIRGGENLFPREIEDFLNTHENILETHVVSIFVALFWASFDAQLPNDFKDEKQL